MVLMASRYCRIYSLVTNFETLFQLPKQSRREFLFFSPRFSIQKTRSQMTVGFKVIWVLNPAAASPPLSSVVSVSAAVSSIAPFTRN